MNKLFYMVAMSTILLACGLLLYFFYLSFFPIKVVTLNKPLTVEPKIIKSGESITIAMDFTKHQDYKPNVKYYLVCDGYSEPLTQDGTNRPAAHNIINIIKVIPIETKSTNDCHIQIDLSYQITPIRTVNYIWKTDKFRVVNAE